MRRDASKPSVWTGGGANTPGDQLDHPARIALCRPIYGAPKSPVRRPPTLVVRPGGTAHHTRTGSQAEGPLAELVELYRARLRGEPPVATAAGTSAEPPSGHNVAPPPLRESGADLCVDRCTQAQASTSRDALRSSDRLLRARVPNASRTDARGRSAPPPGVDRVPDGESVVARRSDHHDLVHQSALDLDEDVLAARGALRVSDSRVRHLCSTGRTPPFRRDVLPGQEGRDGVSRSEREGASRVRS